MTHTVCTPTRDRIRRYHKKGVHRPRTYTITPPHETTNKSLTIHTLTATSLRGTDGSTRARCIWIAHVGCGCTGAWGRCAWGRRDPIPYSILVTATVWGRTAYAGVQRTIMGLEDCDEDCDEEDQPQPLYHTHIHAHICGVPRPTSSRSLTFFESRTCLTSNSFGSEARSFPSLRKPKLRVSKSARRCVSAIPRSESSAHPSSSEQSATASRSSRSVCGSRPFRFLQRGRQARNQTITQSLTQSISQSIREGGRHACDVIGRRCMLDCDEQHMQVWSGQSQVSCS
jgi:hypothetical protein